MRMQRLIPAGDSAQQCYHGAIIRL